MLEGRNAVIIQKETPAVAKPGVPASKKTGKTYDDLSDHDKSECERFERLIPGFTKEQFVKEYQWDKE